MAADPAQSGRRGSYRSGFFFGSLSFGATLVLGLASTVLTARLYGVEVVGDYALVFAPVSALWVLSTVKEQQALIREITKLEPRPPRVTQMFAATFAFSTALTVLVAALDALACVLVFPGALGRPDLLAPALVSIAGYVLVTNTGWNLDSILAAFVAGRALFRVRVNEAVAFIVLATVFGIAWDSVWGLVAAAIGASAIALVHRLAAARHFVRPRLRRGEFRQGLRYLPDILRFGLRATPGQIFQGVSQQGATWAIGIVAPAAVVGAYSRAQVIPKSVQQASMKITEVLFPTLVARRDSGDGHGFDRAMVDSIRYEVIGMLLLAASLGGAAGLVMRVFGPGFEAAAPALVLLLLFPVIAAVSITQTQALWALDRPGLTSLVSGLRMVVTVALLVVLTPSMNYVGPPLALLAGMLVAVAIYGFVLRSHMTRPLPSIWPRRERFVLVLATAAGFGAARGVEAVWDSLAALPFALLAGSLVYLLVLVLLGGLNERDWQRLGSLAGRTPMRRLVVIASAALGLLLLLPGAAGANLYWSDRAAPELGRATLDGAPQPGLGWLAAGAPACGIAVDPGHVYWTRRDGRIGRAGIDGSSPEPEFVVLPEGSACGVAVDATHLYWASATSGKLGRAALDGSAVEPAWMSPGKGHGCGVAVDGAFVYWASERGVYRAPLAGGPATTISTVTKDNCGVAVNAAHVYWASGEGLIERDRLGGGPPTTIATAAQDPCGIAVDDDHVYWASAGSGAISRANLDGSGLVRRFAESGGEPCGVAVDALAGDLPAPAAGPSNVFRLGGVTKNRRRGTARLRLLLPGPGSLVVTGRKVRESRLENVAVTPPPGQLAAVRVAIRPRRATRRLLRVYGLVVAPLNVTFTPAGGEPRTRYTRVWLAQRRERVRPRPHPRPRPGPAAGSAGAWFLTGR